MKRAMLELDLQIAREENAVLIEKLCASEAEVARLTRELEDVRRFSEQLRFKARSLAEFCKTYIAMPSDRLVALADRVIDHVHGRSAVGKEKADG